MSTDTVQQTGSKTLTCYEFTATNNTGREVTDIHIPLGDGQKTEIPPMGPEGWQGRHDKRGVNWKTPPDIPPNPGGTSVRPMPPNPIPKGGRLGPFKFYLDGRGKAPGMFFTFPESEETTEGSVEQGGTVIEPTESGTVKPTGLVHCFEITVTAPRKMPIFIVELKTNKELVHGATDDLDKWTDSTFNRRNDNGSTTGCYTAFSIGDKNPIAPGKSRTFRLYSSSRTLDVEFNLYDDKRNEIESGSITVKRS